MCLWRLGVSVKIKRVVVIFVGAVYSAQRLTRRVTHPGPAGTTRRTRTPSLLRRATAVTGVLGRTVLSPSPSSHGSRGCARNSRPYTFTLHARLLDQNHDQNFRENRGLRRGSKRTPPTSDSDSALGRGLDRVGLLRPMPAFMSYLRESRWVRNLSRVKNREGQNPCTANDTSHGPGLLDGLAAAW